MCFFYSNKDEIMITYIGFDYTTLQDVTAVCGNLNNTILTSSRGSYL